MKSTNENVGEMKTKDLRSNYKYIFMCAYVWKDIQNNNKLIQVKKLKNLK